MEEAYFLVFVLSKKIVDKSTLCVNYYIRDYTNVFVNFISQNGKTKSLQHLFSTIMKTDNSSYYFLNCLGSLPKIIGCPFLTQQETACKHGIY